MNTDEKTVSNEATPSPTLKWYRAVMAFIWVSAIFYIGYFGPKCLGLVSMDSETDFAFLKTLNIILLIFSFVLAVFAYIVWRELHKKSLLAPRLLLIWHILAIVCWGIQLIVFVHHAGFDDAIIQETVIDGYKTTSYGFVRWFEIQALVAFVCNVVLLVVNCLYFRKRSEVFSNGDGSIGSLFRWQKKPAPAEVAEDPEETATTKKLPVRQHRVTRILAWISALSGAIVTCAWWMSLFAWNQKVQGALRWNYGENSEIFQTMLREGQETRILLVVGILLVNIAAILYAYAVWSGLLDHKAGTPNRIVPLCVFNLSFWIQGFVKGFSQFDGLEQLIVRVELSFGDVFSFWIVILIHAALAILGYLYFKKRKHQFQN